VLTPLLLKEQTVVETREIQHISYLGDKLQLQLRLSWDEKHSISLLLLAEWSLLDLCSLQRVLGGMFGKPVSQSLEYA
jgi:hypothetical protein